MGLSKVGNSQGYLDLKNLNFRDGAESIAYLQFVMPKRTSDLGSAYLSFIFREVGGNPMRGVMFDVDRFAEKGYDIIGLRNRPVKVVYKVQERSGSLSLLVRSVEEYKGHFEYEKFMGQIPTAKNDLDRANRTTVDYFNGEDPFPLEYATDVYVNICGGRAGGYAKLVWSVLRNLGNYMGTPGIDNKDFLVVAVRAIKCFAKYNKILATADFSLNYELLRLISEFSENESPRISNIIADTCSAILGLTEPQHLYAHIICSELKGVNQRLAFSYDYPTMVDGSTRRGDEGLLLAKY